MKLLRLVAILVMAALSLTLINRGADAAGAPAAAAEQQSLIARFDGALVDLPFEKGFDDTLMWLQRRLGNRYAPMIKDAKDANERREIRERVAREYEKLRESEVKLEGPRTAFDTSIIQRLFVKDADESLVVQTEGERKHYLLFTHGKLWRYATPVVPSGTFRGSVETLVARLGAPTERGKEMAAWEDATHRIEIFDRRTVFGADLLVVTWRPLLARIDKLRGGKKPPAEGGIDSDLEDFLDPGDEEGYQPGE